MIAAVLDKAYATFCQKSDTEYFETIKAMLNKFALAEDGEVIFSAKDLERMPDGFAEEIQKIAAAKGGTPASIDPKTGLLILAACLPIGIVGLISGKYQGKTAAASIGIVAKKPEQFGKAMLFPAMVETYAILALLISILAVSAIPV